MTTITKLEKPLIKIALPTSEQIAQYNREGYFLFKGAISPESAGAIKDEVMEIMNQIGLGRSKLKQSGHYLAGTAIDALVNSSRLLRTVSDLMGGPSTLYLPFTAVKSGGGGGRFNFHQDNQYTRFDAPGINMWFALSPMSVENGCLQVVPGSHKNGTLDANILEDGHRMVKYEPDDFVSVLMEPGDCVAFTRLTVHGSGPNSTPDPRVAYAVQFHRDDVRATWDGYPTPTLLKEHPKTKPGPADVKAKDDGKEEDLDGH